MQKILMSACLLGIKVRYDGGDCAQNHILIQKWHTEGRIITLCPEVAGGLPTPRPPAEIIGKKVMTNTGVDFTTEFHQGAKQALDLCQKHHIKFALLKSRSPSCGSSQIYDGTFSRTLIEGLGITATLLKKNGVQVFDESQLHDLEKSLDVHVNYLKPL